MDDITLPGYLSHLSRITHNWLFVDNRISDTVASKADISKISKMQEIGHAELNNKPTKSLEFTTTREMGLRRKSISMPKLFTKDSSKDESLFISDMERRRHELHSEWEQSQIVQIYSGKQKPSETKPPPPNFHQLLLQSSSDSATLKKHKPFRTTNKSGFSERIKGMFNSWFNLDTHNIEDMNMASRFPSDFSASFNASTTSNARKSTTKELIRHSKSLPDLNQQIYPGPKSLSAVRRQKSLLFNWPRKLKQRRNRSKTEEENSRPSSSCDSSPDVGNSRKKITKPGRSIGSSELIASLLGNHSSQRRSSTNVNNDNSVSSSPSSFADITRSNERVFFDEPSELSQTIKGSNGEKIGRKMFRAKTAEGHLQAHQSNRRFLPRSYSECSEKAPGVGQEEKNSMIISNASAAAQKKRHLFGSNKSKSLCNIEHNIDPQSLILDCNNDKPNNLQNSKLACSEKQNEIFYNIIQRSLGQTLREKEFHPENTKLWCKDIAESIKGKIQYLTGGVYKIAVQVFIGAVEEEGISTSSLCIMNANTDNFTIGSFRNNSLFALASVLAIDYCQLPAKSFQNMLYSRVHESRRSKDIRHDMKKLINHVKG